MSAAHSFLTISLATVLFSVAPLSCASTADIISRLKIAPVIEGRFIQKEKLVSVPKPFECEGFFIFWKDDVLLWKATKPILTTSLYTDQNFKTYIHLNGKRIENTSPSATNIVNRILWGLLSADMTALELDFQIFSQNKPESCIACGSCSSHCPQMIDIPLVMEQFYETAKPILEKDL